MSHINSKLIDIAKKFSFYLIAGVIFIIFIFDQILGIILAGSFFIVYLVYYLFTLSFKKRVLRFMQEHLFISDTEVADKLKRPLGDIREIMSSLSKNQKKKKWLVVFLNKRYIFLNEQGVENYKHLYNRGYTEKKILEELQPEMKLRSRAEVKAIELTLINHGRLNN
ncbi:MAG: hypothetical protein ACFFFT_17900 [Candidatus Thorarchaeota archaeon]